MSNEPNIQILIKLLRMTESPHDGEALNAIRMANSMLNKHDSNWEDLMRSKVPMIDDDPFKYTPKPKANTIRYTDENEINAYFAALNNRDLGTFRDYVNDVEKWWKEKNFLTQKQYDVIKKSANRSPRS